MIDGYKPQDFSFLTAVRISTTMAGINYINVREDYRFKHSDCIFISHQKADRVPAKKIADFLISKGINVYFDEYDKSIDRSNPDKLTASIQRGIDFSKYMLILISPNTLYSKWVPWEVGYGYNKVEMSVLTLKGIREDQLPEYLQTTKVCRNYAALRTLIQEIKPELINESQVRMFSASHPLYNILDI